MLLGIPLVLGKEIEQSFRFIVGQHSIMDAPTEQPGEKIVCDYYKA